MLPVVIPSMGRANRVLARRAVAGAILCVPESQAEDYRRNNRGTEIVAHPDEVKGLPLKRQWIYDKWGDVFMIDDDVDCFMRLYRAAGRKVLTAAEGRDLVEATYGTAKNLGAYLYGFATASEPRFMKPQNPIRLTGFCTWAWGLRAGSKLYFDAQAATCEDWFVSALNAHHHRFAFFDDRFAPHTTKTARNPGGNSNFRTVEAERRGTEFLKKMFGSVIQEKGGAHKSADPTGHGRTMYLPF